MVSRLRRELKEAVANQLSPSELELLNSKGPSSPLKAMVSGIAGSAASGTMDSFDQARLGNMEKQLKLLASVRRRLKKKPRFESNFQ